jgi:hypothetical protein
MSSSEQEMKSVEYRHDNEPPAAVAKFGWRYPHISGPTGSHREDERYIPQYKIYVSGFGSSPYGIEWVRFEPDSLLPEIIRTLLHIAFEVDDLKAALQNQEVIFPPGTTSDGVRTAMIIDNGAPVELITFEKKNPVAEG